MSQTPTIKDHLQQATQIIEDMLCYQPDRTPENRTGTRLLRMVVSEMDAALKMHLEANDTPAPTPGMCCVKCGKDTPCFCSDCYALQTYPDPAQRREAREVLERFREWGIKELEGVSFNRFSNKSRELLAALPEQPPSEPHAMHPRFAAILKAAKNCREMWRDRPGSYESHIEHLLMAVDAASDLSLPPVQAEIDPRLAELHAAAKEWRRHCETSPQAYVGYMRRMCEAVDAAADLLPKPTDPELGPDDGKW